MTQPDFIIIPTQLLCDDALRPSDRVLFGYIYWMTKLALMKCVASNAKLAALTGISERGVRLGLERLENRGYVDRIYTDEISHHRVEIVCRVAYSAAQPPKEASTAPDLGTNVPTPRNKRSQPLGTFVPHNKKIINRIGNKKVIDTSVSIGPGPEKGYGRDDINQLFAYWQQVTGIPIQSNVQRNRNACSNLLKRHGAAKVRQMIDGVALAQQDPYAPRISDFPGLQSKLNALLVWGRQRGSSKVVVIA